MLSHKILIAIFAVFISLGMTGMALAEPVEASYVTQTAAYDSYSSAGDPGNVEAANTPADSGVQKDNEPRVRCANFDVGGSVDSNENSTADCKTLYGV
jgi:hypothetical protein